MSPIIKHEGGDIVTYCPFCKSQVYRREPGPNAEFSCLIAFGMHVASCKESPDYKETEMDKFLKELHGE